GWTSLILRTASRPSEASATTPKPFCVRRSRRPSRNMAWSSAMRIPSDMALLDGNDRRQAGPRTLIGVDEKSSADGGEPGPDSEQSDASAAAREAAPVVADGTGHMAVAAPEPDAHSPGAGVSHGVGERLLHRAIQSDLHIFGEPAVQVELERNRQACPC